MINGKVKEYLSSTTGNYSFTDQRIYFHSLWASLFSQQANEANKSLFAMAA